MPERASRRRVSSAGALVAIVAVAVVGAVVGGLGSARPAAAESVSREQLEVMADQAAGGDPTALRRLRQVDVVDGRRADLRQALAGAEGRVLDARLRALAGSARRGAAAEGRAPSAAIARADARRILLERRFRPARPPRPLRGVLRRLGGWLRPVLEPVGRFWDDVAGNTFGRVALVAAVIGLAALTSIRMVHRRTAAGVAPPGVRERRRPEQDPDALERRADQAERDGSLDLAVRLRFRAGLVRLDRAGLVPWRPTLTTGQLTRTLRSPAFDDLALAFDEIAYGGRGAVPDDLHAARAGWPRVLREAHPAQLGEQSGAMVPL